MRTNGMFHDRCKIIHIAHTGNLVAIVHDKSRLVPVYISILHLDLEDNVTPEDVLLRTWGCILCYALKPKAAIGEKTSKTSLFVVEYAADIDVLQWRRKRERSLLMVFGKSWPQICCGIC